jgi:hypothetical protein
MRGIWLLMQIFGLMRRAPVLYVSPFPIFYRFINNTVLFIPRSFQILELINIAAKTGTGFYDEPYELIFSDEIKIENRTLYLGGRPLLGIRRHLVRCRERFEEWEAGNFDGECLIMGGSIGVGC